jgi:5,10-methylenetetrahydrofolate reductase
VEPQVTKMRKKIEVGAQFFQTQAVYDGEQFQDFMERTAGYGVPVIAGIVVLKSAAMARYMNEHVAGVSVPEAVIREMEVTAREDRPKKAVETSARIIRQVMPFCQGVHVMPLGWDELVPEILREADLSTVV